MTTWRKNEATAARRRCTLIVAALADGSWAPAATDLTGLVFVRLGDTSWVASSGTVTNTGEDGRWIYEATQAETNIAGNDLEVRVTDTTFYALTEVTIDHGDGDETAVVEDSLTRDDILRGIFAMVAGKMLGVDAIRDAGGVGDADFYSADGATIRVRVTYSSDGRPTITILDLT